MSNTGGPAFPYHGPDTKNAGMTLRDYFAAKAMQGLMGRDWSHLKVTDAELFTLWAQSSYFAADAMLAAREQK